MCGQQPSDNPTMVRNPHSGKPLRDKHHEVNSGVDTELRLVSIPGVHPEWEESHPVRALEINGVSPALDALADWKRVQQADFKKIMKVIERVARLVRVLDEKHVTPDARRTGIYEMRAHRGHARLMFFYEPGPRGTAVCVLPFWKGVGNQRTAFDRALAMKRMWDSSE